MNKLRLAHLPTPLWHNSALDEMVGAQVWVKRDDMTSGAAAGNKLRKLEYLLGDALHRRATVVLTCGGVQSNHARATAVAARELGMRALLFLGTPDGKPPAQATGNLFLDLMVGAGLRFLAPDQYRQRQALMEEAAREIAAQGERAYVIPMGGSTGLGALGYADAMREVRQQLDGGQGGGPAGFDAVVCACGSGGTAAGCVIGARAFGVAPRVCAMAVCEDEATFRSAIADIVVQAGAITAPPGPPADLHVYDAWKGPAYGVASDEQRHFIVEVAERSGLVLDPVYTGKALFGLARLPDKPRRVLFLHTGGLPGLLAQCEAMFPRLPR
ncbi:MAG: D-cysteine desulfhydrase family protein [Deltaproteobacteria bacterium]|nr:D-cysteine desulfhydrase family protein [Deltaproteobacteria bacterium]